VKDTWVTTTHVDEFFEQMVTVSEPPRAWISEPSHPRLCRLVTTSKLFSARPDQLVFPSVPAYDYQALERVFGHLGSMFVTGPEQDYFYILWGYAKDPSSPEFKIYGTNHLQYFGRRSVAAWKAQAPRCVIAEEEQRRLKPGRSLGRISSIEIPETELSPDDLPSWAVSRRPSGLVIRVDVRLRTFLNRTCVELEISDCPPDSIEPIPTTLRPAAPEEQTDTA
jgi:hypothetical protein